MDTDHAIDMAIAAFKQDPAFPATAEPLMRFILGEALSLSGSLRRIADALEKGNKD
jgi:hypothetical protein